MSYLDELKAKAEAILAQIHTWTVTANRLDHAELFTLANEIQSKYIDPLYTKYQDLRAQIAITQVYANNFEPISKA